jgi:ABC-type transport system substrate-binding protein
LQVSPIPSGGLFRQAVGARRIHVGLPTNVPLYKDRRVRQAFNYAIDFDSINKALLSGVPTRSVRIIHEAVPAEHFSSPIVGAAVRLVARPLRGLLIRWVLEALRRELEQRSEQFAAHFTRAAAAEADGVTVAIEFRQPSFMAPLRGLLSRRTLQVPPVAAGGLFRQAVGDFAITIHPGFVRS